MKENKLIMSNIEAEYLDIAKRNAWPLVYQKIGRECQSYPYTCIEAKKPQNKQLNRYRDVNPYDRSRIVLERGDCDYINANLVKMERAQRRYILTQGPLSFTVGHFWLMIWEQKSRAILMLNKTIEKNEVKCHWYWPQGTGEQYKLELTAVRLSIEQLEEQNFNYYVTRLFRVEDMDTHESREIIQFHYTTWPDFGVPSSPTAFLDFLKKVQESGTLNPEFGPAVVHCSAGIGRSGTFCLVDSCLVIIEKEGPNSINIQQILLEMRKDRMGLIQTPDQLRFSYQAIIEGMKRLDPSWKEEKSEDNESLYCTVAEAEEEAPPPPPPRAESLTRPPARPLPAIPASASMGNLNYPEAESSSDEGPPTPPARESSSSASSADDEDDDPNEALLSEGSETATELRRRRTRELADRVSAMKRRARDAERWHAFKRSLYKPLLTFGVLLAGILIYTLKTSQQQNKEDSLQHED